MVSQPAKRIRSAITAVGRQPSSTPIEEASKVLNDVESDISRIRNADKQRAARIEVATVLFYESIRRDCSLDVTRQYLRRYPESGMLHVAHHVGHHLLYAEYCVHKGQSSEAFEVLSSLRDEIAHMQLGDDTKGRELQRVDELADCIRNDRLEPL
jgi:hypothetical protein